MELRRISAIVLILAGAGLLASCGDDETTISKADFVKQANALCTDLNEALAEPETALGAEPTEEQAAAFLEEVLVPELRSTLASIRDLGFPKGDEERLDGLMDETETILDAIAEDPSLALRAQESPFTEVNKELTAYGLTVCGSDG